MIFKSKFYCKLCKREVITPLIGPDDFPLDEQLKEDVKKWGKHYHWIDFHRVCAICGRLVKSGELKLLINDGSILIHRDYNLEYKKANPRDKFGHPLIVHGKCAKETE